MNPVVLAQISLLIGTLSQASFPQSFVLARVAAKLDSVCSHLVGVRQAFKTATLRTLIFRSLHRGFFMPSKSSLDAMAKQRSLFSYCFDSQLQRTEYILSRVNTSVYTA